VLIGGGVCAVALVAGVVITVIAVVVAKKKKAAEVAGVVVVGSEVKGSGIATCMASRMAENPLGQHVEMAGVSSDRPTTEVRSGRSTGV